MNEVCNVVFSRPYRPCMGALKIPLPVSNIVAIIHRGKQRPLLYKQQCCIPDG